MRKKSKMSMILCLVIAAAITLNVGIPGFNNGHQQNDNLEWDCGGSCHDTQSASTVTMSASNLNPSPGEIIDVTVTVTGAEASNTPLGVMIVRSLTPTNSQPSVDGWVIINDPSGSGSFNYYEEPSVTGGVVWTWQMQAPMTGGTYKLYAREHHGNGARYFSEDSTGLTFTIVAPDNPPSIFITNPGSTPGEQYVQGAMIPVSWVAGDDNPWPSGGLVVNLSYGPTPAGGTPIANGLDVTGGYTWDTTTVAPGVYYINGSVYDSSGQTAWSSSNYTFEIIPPDNPPSLFITNPGSTLGEQYVQGTLIPISWAASDDNPWPSGGNILNLTYGPTPAGGTTIVTLENVGAGTFSWDTISVAPGTYYINGSVYDSSGQTAWSSSNYTFEIIPPDNPPSIFITNPGSTPGEQYVKGSTIQISWAATDDNPWPATGLVVNLSYGQTPAGGTPIANNQDVASPFSWDTTLISPGSYYINASVWDSGGQSAFASSNYSFEIVLLDLPPTLYVTNPGSTPGEVYGQGSVITISWAANDESPWPSGGNVVNISYGATPAGGTPIANNQNVTTTFSWDTSAVPQGFYYVNISVYDSGGNTTYSSSNYSFEIAAPDTTPPIITNLSASPDPQELGLQTNISANITDDTTISQADVFLIVTYPSLTFANLSMARSGDIFWIEQPFMEVGSYSFTLWAADTSANWAWANGTFNIVDTTPPTILGASAIPTPQISGGNVNISAGITDLDSVAVASLEVSDPLGGILFNTSMLYDSFSGRYYWETTYISLGTYSYSIWASDPSGNWASAAGSFDIIGDLIPPIIANLTISPQIQVSGGVVNISAIVTDNIALSGVWVEIFDPSLVSILNTSMSYDIMNGRYYHENTYFAVGTWTFILSASDTSGNWATQQGSFLIEDGTPPTIRSTLAHPSPQEIGGSVNISTAVTDNVGVFDVWVEVFRPDLTSIGNFSMTYDPILDRYYHASSYVNIGKHTFIIWAQDGNSNFASDAGEFEIVDTTPPSIDHQPIAGAEVGLAILISANVTDIGGVASVTLYYTDVGSLSYQSVPMVLGMGNEYSATIPAQGQAGEVRYYILATDSSSNAISHPTAGYHLLTIVDISPPVITNPRAEPDNPEVGDTITISAGIDDESGIEEVLVFISGPENQGWDYQMTFNNDTGEYELSFSPEYGGLYTFKIWARDNSSNWQSASGTFTASMPAPKTPNPPSELKTGSVDGKYILLSWLAPERYEDGSLLDRESIRGYHVYRSESPEGSYVRLTDQPVPGELYLDEGVDPQKTYYYKVATVLLSDIESPLSDYVKGKLEEVEIPTDILPWLLTIVFLVLWLLTLVLYLLGRKGRPGVVEEPADQIPPPRIEDAEMTEPLPEPPEDERDEEVVGEEED